PFASSEPDLPSRRLITRLRKHDRMLDVGAQLELDRRPSTIHACHRHVGARRLGAQHQHSIRQTELDRTDVQRFAWFDLYVARPRFETIEPQLQWMTAGDDLRRQWSRAAGLACNDDLGPG